MKVCLLNIETRKDSCINKDFMGGYGWVFNAGNSFPARLINFVKRIGEKIPIMSFGYLAAIFHNKGHSVEYLENSYPDADLVILQSSMVEHKAEIGWARRLRKVGKKVGFIGPFSSAKPDIFLEEADFVIVGEPEEACGRIADGFIPRGIIESKSIDNLDTIPFPKWDIFPINKYFYFPALKEKPFLPILSSRSCPYACNYCPYLVTSTWRQRSAKNVLDEIGYLIERFRIKSMLFRDPIFSLDHKRTDDIAQGILDRGYRIKWACETRLDKVDKEMLRIMHKAGLRVLNVGIESYSEEIIKSASRRPVDMEHQEEMVRYADKLGIRVTAFYMFGMPDDTHKSLVDTMRYSKRLNTHVAQFFIFTPFPGTRYFDLAQNDIYESDWEKFDCYTPVSRHRNLEPGQILKLKEKAFISYYYRPSWAFGFARRALKDILGL